MWIWHLLPVYWEPDAPRNPTMPSPAGPPSPRPAPTRPPDEAPPPDVDEPVAPIEIEDDGLAIYCPLCHGALAVQCGAYDPSVGPQAFACPYCRRESIYNVNAAVLWVTKGHQPLHEA